jgi:type I restriction enzyme S subunit
MSVPALRFKEFSGDWEVKKLGDLCATFKSGSGITSEHIGNHGDYPVYGGNGLRGYTDSFTHEGFYLLIGRQGALCGNINRSFGKAYISEHAIAVCANETSNTEWLSQKLNLLNLNRLSESSAQPGLAVNKLIKLEFEVPSLPEQTKIANFLTAVDEKISLLTQKAELLSQYKKGVMQQIFKQELRFKDDDGQDFPEWEEKTLGKIADRVVRKNKEDNKNVLTISAQYGLINQQEYFNKSVAAKILTNYYLLHLGDFAYNKSYSNGYPMGAIKCLNRYEKGVVSTLYICFKFKSGFINKFFEQYFEAGLQNQEIEKVAQEGARNHGLLNIGLDDFFSIRLTIPSLPEQTKIANFLSAIDEKITNNKNQLDAVKQYKQGLLQQMFV